MPKKLFLLLPFVLIALVSHAQRDSNANSAIAAAGDTTEVLALVEQSYLLRSSDPQSAKENCLSAIRIARQLKYPKGEGRALGSLGYLYYATGDYVNAVETCREALAISEKIHDDFEIARSHDNIGALEFQQKHYTRAIDNFRQALALSAKIGDERTKARSLNNIATMLQVTMFPRTDSAFHYVRQALVVNTKSGDKYNSTVSNHILGDLYLQEKKYSEAVVYFQKCLAFTSTLSPAMEIDTRNQITEAYLGMNKTDAAVALLKASKIKAERNHAREQLACVYRLLARASEKKGDFRAAYDYQERFSFLQDSIHSLDVSNKLATTQTQSDLEIKQTQIELLTKDTLLNKDEINRQRTQLYTMIGGFIGILFLAGVLVFSYQKIERTNVLLKQRTSELARINNTKDKLFSIISHDFRSPLNSLKGLLSLVENKNLTREEFAMLAEKLRKNFNAVSNDLENLLQWSMAQLQGIQTNLTRINIQPIVDEHISVFQELAKAKSVKISSNIKDGLFGVADEDHIRLVLRNLINNAIKFTPAGGAVEISGYFESPYITIQVTDTGVGMGTEQIETLFHKDRSVSTKGTNQEKGVGLGLLLCAEFVENNGGQLNVASEPGKGSVFSFTLRAA